MYLRASWRTNNQWGSVSPNFCRGMTMLAICKEGEITVSFKRDRNFNVFYNPDQSTSSRTRKLEYLKLQPTFSFQYIVLENCVSREEVENMFKKQHPTDFLPSKPELMVSAGSFAKRHMAAVKLQKVYKSYRTRRNLADCAIVCEELWWKASEFADKSESAISKWARARAMADEVGKGISKDDRAQKLALRHWLEAIDPRHRYGHNLNLYYDVWFWSKSSQPFFYWLDVGDGKEVHLDVCPRRDLQRQRIAYLGPTEREAYEVILEGGKLVYRQSNELVNTTDGSKWIFVLSPPRVLYVGQKKKGQFQHSSFLAGAVTASSGRLVAHNGVIDAIWPYSGHYRPTAKNFMEFVCFLESHDVDLTNVKKYPVDDDVPLCKAADDEHIGGNVGPSDSATANDHGHIGNSNMEASDRESMPLPSKWTTGVGPRIGCLREYPTKLQVMALEYLNLSARDRVNLGTFAGKAPIASPRPTLKLHLSPSLSTWDFPVVQGGLHACWSINQSGRNPHKRKNYTKN